MRKFVLLAVLLLVTFGLYAQDTTDAEKKAMDIYSADMPANAVSTIKIKIRIGNIYPMFYEEKETYKPSDADKARGFGVFQKVIGEYIYPNMVPHKDEITDNIKIKLTPGEFGGACMITYPLSDISNLSASVGDLVSGSNKIPAANIEVRHMIYDYEPQENSWMCRGKHLLAGGKSMGKKNIPRPFTFTVHAPEDVPAGDYTGKIKIMADNKASDVAFTVTILPFKFEVLPDDYSFFIFTYTNLVFDPVYLDKVMKNMKDHGMNSLHTADYGPNMYDCSGGTIKVKTDLMNKTADLLKKNGYKHWILECHAGPEIVQKLKYEKWTPAFNKEFKSALQQIKDTADKNKWPQFVMMYDEPREGEDDGSHGDRTWIDISNYAKMHTEVGLEILPTYMSDSGGKRWDAKDKEADYSSIVPTHKYSCTHGWGGSKKIIANAKQPGKVLWFYNNGYSRLAYGMLVYKWGSLGQAQFWWENGNRTLSSAVGFPTSNAVTVLDTGEIIPVLRYEDSREGINDYKYIYTLMTKLDALKNKNTPSAMAADKLLKDLKPMDLVDSTKGGAEGDTTSEAALQKYSSTHCQEIRERVIKAIMELK